MYIQLRAVRDADGLGDGQSEARAVVRLLIDPAERFACEATLLVGWGGGRGVFGGFATTVYAAARQWAAVVPVPVLLAAAGIALLVGGVAGLYPALRAARLVPAEALWLS